MNKMEGKKKIMMMVVVVALAVLLTSPQTATAIRNRDDIIRNLKEDNNNREVVGGAGDIMDLSNIMLAEAYQAKFGCQKRGEKCGPLYWCCSCCSCTFNIFQGEFRCK